MADLVVQEAYHAHAADNVVLYFKIGTDTLSSPKLPTLELLGHTNYFLVTGKGRNRSYRATGAVFFLDLPAMTISARMGSSLSSVLPNTKIDATVKSGAVGSLSKRLAAISLSASTGIVCGTLTLPDLELAAVMNGAVLCRLDKTIPGISISAAASTPFVANLSKSLPFPILDISMSTIGLGSLDKYLPGIRLSASFLAGQSGWVDADLPTLRLLVAATAHQSSMSLDGNIQPVIPGTVIGGGSMSGPPPTMTNASRFTDLVLRYSR